MANLTHSDDTSTHNGSSTPVLRELQAIRRELSEQRRLFDQFAATFLNAKFPYGKAIDRWRRR